MPGGLCQNGSMRISHMACAGLLVLGLAGCGPKPPVQIGFIGGLTDRNSDNGQSGLNGVMLAVEQFNRSGGLDGRQVEVVAKDDAQNKDVAAQSAQALKVWKVEAVIGPFTSGMAKVIVPITGQAGIFQVSPTITSMDFYGKDDNLFRINRTTRDNARDYARVLGELGQRRVAVAYDTRYRNFIESWLNEFRAAVTDAGRALATEVPYESDEKADFAGVIRQMLAKQPDGLLFIAGALDVARLAQQARAQSPNVPLAAAEWAATEQLIELGGEVVQGLVIVQNFDRDDDSARFKDFSDAYYKRFQRQPGYSSVSAYDAATVVLAALKNRRDGETLKQAALRSGPYTGLQQTIAFDANGDTTRKVFFTEIRDGRYVRLAVQ